MKLSYTSAFMPTELRLTPHHALNGNSIISIYFLWYVTRAPLYMFCTFYQIAHFFTRNRSILSRAMHFSYFSLCTLAIIRVLSRATVSPTTIQTLLILCTLHPQNDVMCGWGSRSASASDIYIRTVHIDGHFTLRTSTLPLHEIA